jgi:hypothetical protein
VAVMTVAAMSCSDDSSDRGDVGAAESEGAAALEAGDGWVDREQWQIRQDDYLAFATEELDPSSPPNVLAHFIRAERDDDFTFDTVGVRPEDFDAVFAKIDAFEDTSDFDMMRLFALWYGFGDELHPDLRAAIEQRMLDFRYWYTDPLPAGVVADKWFWSENHRIIFHTLEYLADRALPDETFSVTGEPGGAHADRGRERIDAWLDEKAEWGFSEWHSDVY